MVFLAFVFLLITFRCLNQVLLFKFVGAMTLNLTTFYLTTLIIMTLSVMIFSITLKNVSLSKTTLDIIKFNAYAEYCYAERH